MYKVPPEYYIRIHHVRPRFKNNIEEVLIYVADAISAIPRQNSDDFVSELNQSLRLFPGNVVKTEKTINNWRTEISALFGFIETDGVDSWSGARAIELSKTQDLIQAFKVFLFSFQYPGAHLKPQKIKEMIEKGVRFKPAQYVLLLLKEAEKQSGRREYITKAEACHCIFNDLRCVRDREDPKKAWERIIGNREMKITYDERGDVIRYAGDIIDYMEIADLLKTYDNHNYYLNNSSNEMIMKFIGSGEWFSEYDTFIEKRNATLDEINSVKNDWFEYVNRDVSDTDFSTDISAFVPTGTRLSIEEIRQRETKLDDMTETELTATDIGNAGEALVFGHECQRVKRGGRPDLTHLIQKIPTYLGVGYDILSVEIDERKRHIEVKTTVSSRPLSFFNLHLTTNEWNTAQTLNESYYVYRLMISKTERKLFVIKDPVGLYKKNMIKMELRNGAEITFSEKTAGGYEELLIWTED